MVDDYLDIAIGFFGVLSDELDATERATDIRRQEVVVAISQRCKICNSGHICQPHKTLNLSILTVTTLSGIELTNE
jgi:hypothetical protein